jgi:hypothetical protein
MLVIVADAHRSRRLYINQVLQPVAVIPELIQLVSEFLSVTFRRVQPTCKEGNLPSFKTLIKGINQTHLEFCPAATENNKLRKYLLLTAAMDPMPVQRHAHACRVALHELVAYLPRDLFVF